MKSRFHCNGVLLEYILPWMYASLINKLMIISGFPGSKHSHTQTKQPKKPTSQRPHYLPAAQRWHLNKHLINNLWISGWSSQWMASINHSRLCCGWRQTHWKTEEELQRDRDKLRIKSSSARGSGFCHFPTAQPAADSRIRRAWHRLNGSLEQTKRHKICSGETVL